MKVFLDTNILIDLGEHRENALYAVVGLLIMSNNKEDN